MSFAYAEGLKELFQKSANSAGAVKTNQIADWLINALILCAAFYFVFIFFLKPKLHHN